MNGDKQAVTLITGARNVGKTRYMGNLAQSLPRVGGVLCEKWFEGQVFRGYQLRCLQTGAYRPFLIWCPEVRERENQGQENQEQENQEQEWIGPFVVDAEGLSFGKACVLSALSSGCQQVVLDEVGMAELEGRLFGALLKPILAWATRADLGSRDYQDSRDAQAFMVVQAQALPLLLERYPELREARVIEVIKEDSDGG